MTTKSILLMIASLLTHFLIAQTSYNEVARYRGKPIIQMTINEKTAWVLLDTGSDITVLNSDHKEEFGFYTFVRHDDNLIVPGFGSTNNKLERAHHVKVFFGATRLHGSFLAFDISHVSNSIKSRTGKEISAIIGTDLMRKYGFVIDLRNGTASMTQRIDNREIRRSSRDHKFAMNFNEPH
ncbi:MAG: aspartyl protease family protein [Cyclobacteriaceae bacterium]